MHRREFMQLSAVAVASLGGASSLLAQQGASKKGATLPTMTIYKSASCGCCGLWVAHVGRAGFPFKVVDTEDLSNVKREMAVPPDLHSCHTVVVGNYILEGHVPAEDVKKLLVQKPKIIGLAVPGMPIGSPGMEQGPRSGYDRYNVIAFGQGGARSIFASH